MDNRDEIIRTQMDVISTLINNNLRNIGSDLWGDGLPEEKPAGDKQAEKKPEAQAAKPRKTAQQTQQEAEQETPPEDISIAEGCRAQPSQTCGEQSSSGRLTRRDRCLL